MYSAIYNNFIQDEVLNSFKRVNDYASDAISHYHHFMDHMMPFIITEYSKVEVPSSDGKHKQVVQLRNVVVKRPFIDDSDVSCKGIKTGYTSPMTPMEARNRGLTYSAQVLVDIEHNTFNMSAEGKWVLAGEPIIYREMPLFEMPVMLRSKYCYLSEDASAECWMDLGGYFIIRGNAKVLQPQKVQRNNVHLIKGSKHNPISMDCRSRRDDEKFRSTSTLYMHLAGAPPLITVDIPFLKSGLPVVCLFRLLGIHSAEEISHILWNCCDENEIESGKRLFAYNFSSQFMNSSLEDILDFAGSTLNIPDSTAEKVRKQVLLQVSGELLPHVGFDDSQVTRTKKIAYVCIIIRRMIDVYLGKSESDDRDFEGHKSVQMSAGVLSVMFRQQFAATMKTLRNRMYDRYKKGKHLDISALFTDALSRDVLKAFSEGEVTVQKEASNAGTSVIQIAQQVNPLWSSHIGRVSTALPRDGKYKQLRGVDPTQLFVFCPTETPEGHGCGLLQNLATFARVRVGQPLKHVESSVLSLGLEESSTMPQKKKKIGCLPQGNEKNSLIRPFKSLADLNGKNSVLVFVNSDPVGVTECANTFIKIAREARRKKILPFDCSIVRAEHGICISSDMGVIVFPLIHLPSISHLDEALSASKNGGEELWNAMCRLNMIEYMCAHELLEYRAAFTPEEVDRSIEIMNSGSPHTNFVPFSHLSPHPSGFMGTCAASVPWPDHDQAPRVAYQAGMVKQAISTPAANLRERMDMNYAYELWYPQKPLAETAIAKATGMNDWPMGENLIIAIAPYGGCSQEDSIIRNKASVERGSGRVTLYRVFRAICRKRGNMDNELLEHPLCRQVTKCEGLRGNVNYDRLGFDGLPEEGTPVKNGDAIIGRVSHSYENVPGTEESRPIRRDRSIILTCDPHEKYIVDKVMLSMTKEGARMARVKLRSVRIPQEGDKISSRHGQKGTIGIMLPEEDMPYVMSGNNAGMRPDAIINLHRCVVKKMLSAECLRKKMNLVENQWAIARNELRKATNYKVANHLRMEMIDCRFKHKELQTKLNTINKTIALDASPSIK